MKSDWQGSKWFHRYDFARRYRDLAKGSVTDTEFVVGLGFARTNGTDWRTRETPPATPTGIAIALDCEVDPGWLLCGEVSAAPAPPGWDRELEKLKAATAIKSDRGKDEKLGAKAAKDDRRRA